MPMKKKACIICLWVNWSRLYINKLRKKCGYSYNKPENEPNISISFIAFKTSSLLLQYRVVSSASYESLILWFFSSNLTVIPFISLQLLKFRVMISTDKTNNNADKGHLDVFHESFWNFQTPSHYSLHMFVYYYIVF